MSPPEARQDAPRDYVYDPEFAEERARLAGMEGLWDPGTFALLTELGVTDGWHCLELGAGGGSVTQWLATAVGTTGRVVAADIDTRFVDALASDVVDVQRFDLRADPLPQSAFDLIHARLLLEHLPDRRDLLPKLVAALKPGGTIVIEDYDWTGFGFLTTNEISAIAAEAVLGFMADNGFSPHYGREVTGDLATAGLVEARGEGRARVIDSSHPGYAFFRLSFESIKDAVVASGRLTAEQAAEAVSALDTPDTRLMTPVMVAAIGRRPA